MQDSQSQAYPISAVVLGSLAAAGIATYYYVTHVLPSRAMPKGLKPLSAAPKTPGRHILTGNLRSLRRPDAHRVLTAWAEELGPIYTVNLMGQDILVLTDIDIARTCLKGPTELLKFEGAYKGSRQAVSPGKTHGIFNITHQSDLPHHAALRKAVATSFNARHLQKVFPRVRQHALDLAEALSRASAAQPGEELEISPYIIASAIDNTADINFEMKMRALDDPTNNRYIKDLHGAMTELSKRIGDPLREPLQELLWFLPSNRRIAREHEDAYKLYQHIIDTIKSRGPPSDENESVWASIIRARDEHGRPIEGDRLMSIVGTVFIAAIDSAATSVRWALYNIVRHPDVYSKLESELKTAGLVTKEGKPGRLPEWADLTNLSYFNMAMKESMRLHNVAGNTVAFRVTSKATQIGEYWVPTGTPVWIPLYALCNTTANFPNPNQFIPERWSESVNAAGRVNLDPGATKATEKVKETAEKPSLVSHHDWTSLAFSQGSRSCVGLNQGLMQVRITLLVLLSRLHFTVGPTAADPDKMDAAQEMSLTVVSGLGFPFIIKPR